MLDRAVLMCPPDHFTVRDVKNPFMEGSVVDRDLAVRQWNALRAAFESAGLRVETVPAVDDLEDMVFAANQAFVGTTPDGAPFVVPGRMRYPSRQREVPYYMDWFRANGYEVLDLDLREEYLEGCGDLMVHPGRRHVWAGCGARSSRGGVEAFARAMRAREITVTPLELVDPTFYHLDTCFAPLGEEAALVYVSALAPRALEALDAGWERLYPVDRADAMEFVCNGVVAGSHYVASHISPTIAMILERESLTPLAVDLSEFEKAGGSAFCLKTFVA